MAEYAEDEYRWLFFRDDPFEGVIWTLAVYLGSEALRPELVPGA